ncbi:uncharacterized protein EV420DRAFT_1641149 [Desarmillaria tabescens]|uniref:Uncharacterized protein n=1 Tax=Armillaria tabescens TaxID=1929756 RepID=A0AA39N7S3_ARMTA|nr:uncharacterized protein EV420DRAFT_1641149 [Desarmillaria tabescens]KAK0460599.1 hypothetical protein EV420DRAFT_1641149 [Desarmillaria tabescens]
MDYEGDNSSSKHSRSDSDISFPHKRSSPPLLLDERLTPEEVQSIVDLHLDDTREELSTVLQSDPSGKASLTFLAVFAEQLLRGACNFEKAEINIHKLSINSLRRLLQTDEEVFGVVLNAARKACDQENTHQSVRDIFRLSAVRLPQTTGVLASAIARGNLATAAEQSWKSQYIGDYPAAIIAEIENHLALPKSGGYGCIGAMIQSSGTGKSRTMHEIAAQIFTIPINIRETDSSSGGAPYPDPDAELRDYLISPGGTLRIRYLCFLCTLFDNVREVLQTLAGNRAGMYTAFLWRTYLANAESNNRGNLYHNVIERARELEVKYASSQSGSSIEQKNLVEVTKKSYRNLIDMLVSNSKLKLLIYIDEAHTLAPMGPGKRNSYDPLCSAMADLGGSNHFIIFMSTTGALSLLGRPKSDHISARAVNVTAKLPAPFTILPFDVYANIQYDDPGLTFERIWSIQHLACFGRPMWHAMLAAGANEQWLIFLARSKLTHKDCAETPKFKIHQGMPVNETSKRDTSKGEPDLFKMALADVRVMIEYEPRREKARRLQEEMVKGHMRVAFSVPDHREYMRSGHPSEPVLAEAAAISTYEEGVDLVDVIYFLLEENLIGKGERGELVGRLLLTLAWDAAIHQLMLDKKNPSMPIAQDNNQAVYSRPMLLLDFLAALLHPDHLDAILQSTPDNRVGGETFAEAFKDAYVCFTHFGRARSPDAINSGSAFAAFIRGMAWQCSSGHPVIDILLPLLIVPKELAAHRSFDVNKLPLEKFHRSGVFISIKDKQNAERKNYTINAETLRFWVKEDEDVDVPYVAILMQLGIIGKRPTTPTPPETPTTPTDREPSTETTDTPSRVDVPTSRTKSQPERKIKKASKAHPRYTIIISGCSPSVYKVIKDDEKFKYAGMLASRGIIYEHPYRKPASLRLLKKMKPFWSLGPECFDWAPGLPGVGVAPEPREMHLTPGITYGTEAVVIEGPYAGDLDTEPDPN